MIKSIHLLLRSESKSLYLDTLIDILNFMFKMLKQ